MSKIAFIHGGALGAVLAAGLGAIGVNPVIIERPRGLEDVEELPPPAPSARAVSTPREPERTLNDIEQTLAAREKRMRKNAKRALLAARTKGGDANG